jgi:excisionase family DNA binding protein
MAVVTISRQHGSHGDEIGQAVAHELGVPYLDKELLRLTAARLGITEADVLDPERRSALVDRLIPRLVLGEVAETGRVAVEWPVEPEAVRSAIYRQVMAEIIRELAATGGAVIVGRGGQVLLSTMPGVLHVAIGASLPTRVRRVAAQAGVSPETAERLVEASDHERSDFLRAEHGVDWLAPGLYDLVITTDRLPIAAAAAAIVAATKALAAQTEGEPTYRRLRQDHYTIREAADLLMLNPDVIRHAVVAGELPAARTGRTISAIRRQDLLRWLEQETVRT